MFINQNQVIFDLIQGKLNDEKLKKFEEKIIKNKIMIYNKGKFEKIIEKIKKKLSEAKIY